MSKLREVLFSSPLTAEPVKESVKPIDKPARAQMTLTHSLLNTSSSSRVSSAYAIVKQRVHRKLIESVDLGSLSRSQGSAVEASMEKILHSLLEEEEAPLSGYERQQLVRDIMHDTLGLGPLEPFMNDPSINDILVNNFNTIWIDRDGKLELTDVAFESEEHLLHIINRIVSRIGRRVDESSPIVDARLPDGSRVNAIIPPLSLDGPILSVRRFRQVPFTFDDLKKRSALTAVMADFLSLCVRARLNILISGGTSAGKTTLLNILSACIPESERVVTIEDTAELRLQRLHVLRLESRPANIEGQGSITQRDLVKNALRMRPDRIIVGEVRGGEALDMLQAMNTGHEGSLTTIHANSARDALNRLETLVMLSGVDLTLRSIREQIGSAIDLVVQIKRLPDGTRKVVSITEVTGVQDGVISLQEIYSFEFQGNDHAGNVLGNHVTHGLRPSGKGKFAEAGVQLDSHLFQAGQV